MDVNADINYIFIWLLTIAIDFSQGEYSLCSALLFRLRSHCNISWVNVYFILLNLLFFFFIKTQPKINLLLLLFMACLVQMGFINNQIYLRLLQFQMDLQFREIFRIVIIYMDLLLDLTRFPLAVQTYLTCLN